MLVNVACKQNLQRLYEWNWMYKDNLILEMIILLGILSILS